MSRPEPTRGLLDVLEVLEVLDPGVLATVQDGGRPGLGALGVARGGAADPASLAVANLLVGNDAGSAGVEVTFTATFRAIRTVTLGLAGADLGAVIPDTGEAVAPGASVTLAAGATLQLRGPAGPRPGEPGAPRGCRAYLAVPGGVAVPEVLGSRATDLRGGFGGRPLQRGDRLAGPGTRLVRPPARWTGPTPRPRGVIQVLPGPHAGDIGDDAIAALASAAWTVGAASDRTGLRLEGPAVPGLAAGELASLGVLPGTIQVPPDLRPIVLLADCQPTGGYPVIAVVATVDRPALGQLAPGDRVTFRVVTQREARAAAAREREAFADAVAHLREAASWDDLWHGAGG